MVSLCWREKGERGGRKDRDGLRQSQAPIVHSNPSPPRGRPPPLRDARVHQVLPMTPGGRGFTSPRVTDGATSWLLEGATLVVVVVTLLLSSSFSANPPPQHSIGTHTCPQAQTHILVSRETQPSQTYQLQTCLSNFAASANHLGDSENLPCPGSTPDQ